MNCRNFLPVVSTPFKLHNKIHQPFGIFCSVISHHTKQHLINAQGTIISSSLYRSVAVLPLTKRANMSTSSSTSSTSSSSSMKIIEQFLSPFNPIVAEGVEVFLAIPAAQQREVLAALVTTAPPFSSSSLCAQRALTRITSSSPSAIEFMRVTRTRCLDAKSLPTPTTTTTTTTSTSTSTDTSSKETKWTKVMDDVVRDTLEVLYGAPFTALQQLCIESSSQAARQVQQRETFPSSSQSGDNNTSTSTNAALLRQAQSTETVHKTLDDASFRKKFGSRRLVYALTHLSIPDELLAVLYIAFLPELPSSMKDIDHFTGAIVDGSKVSKEGKWSFPISRSWNEDDPYTSSADFLSSLSSSTSRTASTPTTAVFYSVGSPASHTRGLGLGTRVIYTAAARIAKLAPPSVTTFVTLSPIPEFLRWMRSAAVSPASMATTTISTSASTSELDALLELYKQLYCSNSSSNSSNNNDASRHHPPRSLPTASASSLIAEICSGNTDWYQAKNGIRAKQLEHLLSFLCRHYLLQVRTESSSSKAPQRLSFPACRVAAFHFGNGASMVRILAGADTSEAGIKRSAGFMVNYAYSINKGADGLRETMLVNAPAFAANPGKVLDAQNPEMVYSVGSGEDGEAGVGKSSAPPRHLSARL